jgi:hypothetical protein
MTKIDTINKLLLDEQTGLIPYLTVRFKMKYWENSKQEITDIKIDFQLLSSNTQILGTSNNQKENIDVPLKVTQRLLVQLSGKTEAGLKYLTIISQLQNNLDYEIIKWGRINFYEHQLLLKPVQDVEGILNASIANEDKVDFILERNFLIVYLM